MSFWTTQKIASVLDLPLSYPSREVTQITTDSRQVTAGSVFVAIKGETHDGHQFIEGAIRSGAVAIISEEKSASTQVDFFQVPSSLSAIRKLGFHYRKSFSIPFIAVVGAVGKTTTKELLTSILQGKYNSVAKTLGSQNGYLGIPITLLSLPPETEVAVIEIGIDEIGAMEDHIALVEPTHVILTKIGPEHLHQLKTVEIAASEELLVFDYAVQKNVPIGINLSDDYVNAWFHKNHSHLPDAQFLTYSLEKSKAPEYLGKYDEDSNELTVQSETLNASFALPLPGEHHAHNLLAAITLSQFFKLSCSEIRTGLSTFKTAFGRTEIHHLENEVEVIGDYYNSNPTSLEAAINLLVSKKGKPAYFAVLGDMLELGDQEEMFHRKIAPLITLKSVTALWLYGPRMKWLKAELETKGFVNVRHFTSHAELSADLKKSLIHHSRVLIKGSRGMKMEKVLHALMGERVAHP